MVMKSPNTTKNNFTESTTTERSTCTELNVRFFAKHKCVHFRITVKPLLSRHLRDPPKCLLNRGCPLNTGF